MQKNKVKHSKFKNTGILFELLTRQITADILSGKNNSNAKDLLFRYFNESKELGKEWQIYNFLANGQLNDANKADRAISIALNEKRKLNHKKLSEEKYNLIKEIKDVYPINDFLKSSIKNYKTYASIYKVLENRDNVFNFNETLEARDYLIETLINGKQNNTKKDDTLVELYSTQDKTVRLLAYKFLVEGINEKYKEFTKEQKLILREYINNISNTNKLKDFVLSEHSKIKKELVPLMEKVDSPVIKIKLNEVVKQLDSSSKFPKGIKDNHIVVLLMAHELINEVKEKLQNG